MDLKRLKEWIGTIEGLAKTAASVFGMIASMWVAAHDVLGKFFTAYGFESPWWSRISLIIIFGALALLLWRSYQGFAQASRLEQPDAFTLRPADPTSLIGRADDLTRLLRSVKQYRLVLLDGESGCGKSALVTAGLVPVLQQTGNLLPVTISEWGDDWVRGPLVEALEALYYATSAADRGRLGWSGPPDLTADTQTLIADFDARLHSVLSTLSRRMLLIADQFDDYQARHRSLFLDEYANWLSPTALGAANPFWNVVKTGLAAGHLHLLVVTRSDSAAGLSCVRFLGEEKTATHTLARVEAEYLRPLLVGIAPDTASPPVVSHPDGGWQDLRERIERDLKAEGAILMQQVRTAILGLRQLALLTPKLYVAAGGLRGLETLVISRAILHAGNAAGGGEPGRRIAAAILRALVVPGGPNQPPKARRLPTTALAEIAGDRLRTDAALASLQREEVVRPAEAQGGDSAWQLDHDYLARAVLAEANRVNRWTVLLNEGKARYDDAADNWRKRYAALLPIATLVRLCWERGKGRFRFGTAAGYARASALKPATLLVCLAIVGASMYGLNQRRLDTERAGQIVSEMKRGASGLPTLELWRAPERLRTQVYSLLRSNAPDLDRAVTANWHLAHAGLEPTHAREAADLLLERLRNERDRDKASIFAKGYIALSSRLAGNAAFRTDTARLRETLEQRRTSEIYDFLVDAYTAAATRSTGPGDVRAAVVFLRSQLLQEASNLHIHPLGHAYGTVVARLSNPEEVKAETEALRSRVLLEPERYIAANLLISYKEAINQMRTPAYVKAEAIALRTALREESRDYKIAYIVGAYQAVVERMNDAATLNEEAVALRERLDQEPDSDIANLVSSAYADVAAKSSAANLLAATLWIRKRLEQVLVQKPIASPGPGQTMGEKEVASMKAASFTVLLKAYEVLAAHLSERGDLASEARALRLMMHGIPSPETVGAILHAYSVIAGRMTDSSDIKAELEALRSNIAQAPTNGYASSRSVDDRDTYSDAYKILAQWLTNAADIQGEVDALRAGSEPGTNGDLLRTGLVVTYADLAAKISDEASVKAAVAMVRGAIEQPKPGYAAALPDLYARVATLLKDNANLNEAVLYLRGRIEHEPDAEVALPLVRAYVNVAERLSDAEQVRTAAEYLRVRVEQERVSATAETYAYAKLAARLNEADVKSAVAFLRRRLIMDTMGGGLFLRDPLASGQADDGRYTSLAQFYVAIASRLRETADLKAEIGALRRELEQDRGLPDNGPADANSVILDGTVNAYAMLVTRLNSVADLEAERKPLRVMLEQAHNADRARKVSHAYAAVSGAMLKLVDQSARSPLILEILTLSGHPYLPEPKEMLGALLPASNVDFGNELANAVDWATKTFRFKPKQFRPAIST